MDALDALHERLERLRPLSAEQLEALFPRWRAEDAPFVYATNVIEGSTLTLRETIAILQDGITIGGKPLRDHVDAVNGRAAYELMLTLARRNRGVGLEFCCTEPSVEQRRSPAVCGISSSCKSVNSPAIWMPYPNGRCGGTRETPVSRDRREHKLPQSPVLAVESAAP